MRGEQLSPDHWLDMFRLLKLPRGTTLEKLTFGDIIKVADEIIANADAIKVFYYRRDYHHICYHPVKCLFALYAFTLAFYSFPNSVSFVSVHNCKYTVMIMI